MHNTDFLQQFQQYSKCECHACTQARWQMRSQGIGWPPQSQSLEDLANKQRGPVSIGVVIK